MTKKQTGWKLNTIIVYLAMILFLFVNHAYADENAIWNEIENRVRQPCYSDCSSDVNPDECKQGCDYFTNMAKGTIFGCVKCHKDNPVVTSQNLWWCCKGFSMDLGNIAGMYIYGSGKSESSKKGVKIAYDRTMSTNWKEVAKNLP